MQLACTKDGLGRYSFESKSTWDLYIEDGTKGLMEASGDIPGFRCVCSFASP